MISHRFFWFIVLGGVLILTSSALSLAGDPVGGLDITIEQIPGGLVKRGKTDGSGNFRFDRLQEGKYRLTLGSPGPQPRADDYNSGRSNTSTSISGGRTQVSITIELIRTGPTIPFKPIEVAIGRGGGEISGRVELEKEKLKKEERKKVESK